MIPGVGMYDVRVSVDGGVADILTDYVQPAPPNSRRSAYAAPSCNRPSGVPVY
jgi:hypothetical protein